MLGNGPYTTRRVRSIYNDKNIIALDNAYVENRDWFCLSGSSAFVPDVDYQTNNVIGRPYVNICNIQNDQLIQLNGIQQLPICELESAYVMGSHSNYYHNMIDHISTAFYYHSSGLAEKNVPIIFRNFSGFVYQGIDLIQTSEAFIFSKLPMMYKAKRLYIPRKVFGSEGILLETNFKQWLRDIIKNHPSLTGVSLFGPRIYISREQASSRSVENEHEVMSCLARSGFEKIVLEELSFMDQLNAFLHAEIIIAPHGAGLCNIIFSQTGTRVVELLPGRTWRPKFFANLATAFDLRYSLQICDGAFGDKSFNVDVDTLVRYNL